MSTAGEDARADLPIVLTNAEWREFQDIPEQGYSHRGWVDHKIAERVWAALAEQRERDARIAENMRPEMGPHVLVSQYRQGRDDACALIAAEIRETGAAS